MRKLLKCKKCGDPIIFIKTSAGKNMPCDPGLIPYWRDNRGKQRIVTPDGEVIACRLEGDPQKITGVGHIPHWATCPNAKEFKK